MSAAVWESPNWRTRTVEVAGCCWCSARVAKKRLRAAEKLMAVEPRERVVAMVVAGRETGSTWTRWRELKRDLVVRVLLQP